MSHNTFKNEAEFFEKKFEELDLRNIVIENNKFENCTFTRNNMNGSSFKNCWFSDCIFEQSDLSNVQFASSDLRSITFKECKLVGVSWIVTKSLMHTNWQDCILSYGNFSGLDLRKSIMKGCKAHEIDLAETNLNDAILCGTDFAAARFANTNLTKADLRQAINYAIRPDSNKIKKARFSLPEATSLLYGLDIDIEG